jgi:hypothetical protein
MDDPTELVPGDRRADGLGEGTGPQLSFYGSFRMGRPRGGYEYLGGHSGSGVDLTLFPKGLRISASKVVPLKYQFPTWEARYDELIDVSAVGFFPRCGVRFYADHTNFGLIIFYTIRPSGVLEALAIRGIRVNVKPIRFGFTRVPPRIAKR